MSTAARRRIGRPADPELAARRRADLITAATEVFSDIGYTKAGVSEITDRAGLGKGTFYQYFDSKRDIFDAVVDAALERVATLIADSAGSLKTNSFEDLENGARGMMTGLFTMVDEHPHILSTLLGGFQDEEIKQRLLSLSAALESTAAVMLRQIAEDGHIRTDLDFDVVAHIVVGVALNAGVRMLRDELTTPDERQHYIESIAAAVRSLLT
ncbi:TetR/AcrR family transcriptional regulator [Mycobacteroides chelonae]